MNNEGKNKSVKDQRRALLKGLSSGAVASAAVTSVPTSWVKPVVNAVVLPAHAMTTSCVSLLEQMSASVPAACSGGLFPEISIEVQVTTASSTVEITDITVTLPGQATMSGVNVGDVFTQGDTFLVAINNYPSVDQFACLATDPGNIEIEYNCERFAGAAQILNIDVLKTILDA